MEDLEKIFLIDGLKNEKQGETVCKNIRSLPGVTRASFLYTTGKMTVVFDESKTGTAAIIATAVRFGCDITSI